MNKLLLTAILALVFIAPRSFADTVTAPSFVNNDIAGNEISLPSKQPGVDIYLFWATWCPYCKALMPHLQSIQVEYGKDVRVYALHIRDDEDPAVFMEEKGYDFVLLPEADSVMEIYGVRSTPAVFLVDQNGNIRFNLYEMIFDDSEKYQNSSNREKAALRAPYWAAAMRTEIDRIIAEQAND
jgi:thiol-disulfide isomerase/thioredoxin